MAQTSITQAVILAGGRGERLKPLTNHIPKPMASVNGRPFLEYLIEMLCEQGIEEVVLLVGYKHEKIKEYFGDGSKFGARIVYSVGTAEDETGTRVRNARELLDEQFLLLYCDNYWPLELGKMQEFYEASGALVSTVVYSNKDGRAEYGIENNIALDDSGRVLMYDKTRTNARLNGVDIGFFIVDKRALEYIPEGNVSFEQSVLPRLVAEQKLFGYRTDHQYYTITSYPFLRRAEQFLAPQKNIFLDRDGVINRICEGRYVTSWDLFEFLPHTIEALKLLMSKGYRMYVVTNQGGISRGIMGEETLKDIHANMAGELSAHGIRFDGIYYCPHHDIDNCVCRKPKPGMLHRAAGEHGINLHRAIMVGDRDKDIEAGEDAGCDTELVNDSYTLLDVAKKLL